MELEVLKNESDFLEFKIKGERHSFPNLLKAILLKDSNVAFAAYTLEHPQDSDAKFAVRTKGKNAKKALQDAVESISEELSSFEKALKKAIK